MVQHAPWQLDLPKARGVIVNSVTQGMTIYTGCDGYAYTVDPASGTIGSQARLDDEVKSASSDMNLREVSLALAQNGALLVVGYQGYVLGLDPVSLAVQWSTSLPKTGYDVVTVKVYSTNSSADSTNSSVESVYAGSAGRVFKIDPGSGVITQSNQLPGRGKKRIDLCHHKLLDWIVVGTNGYMIALDMVSMGTIKEISLPKCGYDRVSVADGGDRIYAASQGYLYQIGPGFLELKDQASLPGSGKQMTHLSVFRDDAQGDVLAVGSEGKLYCYRSQPGLNSPKLVSLWSQDLSGSGDVRVLALDGIIYASNRGYVYGLSSLNGDEMRKEDLVGRGLGEVTLQAYNQYLLMGISGWLAYAPPPMVNFNLQQQQQRNWCWLAAAVSIASYYAHNVQPPTWTQCKLANQLLNETSCCTNGSTPGCDMPGRTQHALSYTGHLDQHYDRPFDLEHIAEAMSYDRPLVAGMFATYVGHSVVITGVHPNGTVDVKDPSNGQKSTISFNTLRNSYAGTMQWRLTRSTKP